MDTGLSFTQALHAMKTILYLICLTFTLLSCSKDKGCNEAESSVPAVIRSISGPDTLSVGETVAIIVEVAATDSFCTKRAEGYIIEVVNDYVRIGATRIQNTADRQHCDCVQTPTVKTLVYFTPNKKGKYRFGTQKQNNDMSNANPDTSIYAIVVP
ncbi:MAG: hypothetical protein JNL13_01455 [Chitinophagaceae bacterium]|nr:hypothetical protein [Chitinophagaceae bacterium]